MKKLYVKPDMIVINVEAETLMAASDLKAAFDGPQVENDYVDAKGHSFDVWGDDEDED